MENNNKVEVKFKLDKHRFIRLEVEEEKLPIVRENNREISRNEKREVRHESMYSLRAGEKRNIRNKVRTERHVKHRNKEIEE